MGKINVRIIDEKSGLKSIPDARAVRIRSKKYSLLIMEDYTPALGAINGDVYVLTEDEETAFKGVSGFYKQQDNEFTLLIEHHGEDEAVKAASSEAPEDGDD